MLGFPRRASRRTAPTLAVLLAAGLIGTAGAEPGAAQPALTGDAAGIRTGALAWRPCSYQPDLSCATVHVPLDWRSSGTSPRIALHLERIQPAAKPAGVMLLVAGGPGVGASVAYGPPIIPTLRWMLPGWTVILVDARGTGRSAPLACPQISPDQLATPSGVRACQRELGRRSHFYTTADNVRDLEAVRQALGAPAIGLFGTSYGTKVVQAYAHTYPARLSRILLDSVVSRYGPDPMLSSTWRAFPRVLRDECAGGACLAATRAFAASFIRLANRSARHPLRGLFYDGAGAPVRAALRGGDLLDLAISGDESPYIWLELPAAAQAALTGRPGPLLRLASIADPPPLALNPVVGVATPCEELAFPWSRTAPLAGRARVWRHAVRTAPAGTFGPFGPWAALQNAFTDYGRWCQGWRAAPAPPDLGHRPLPKAPALVIAGSDDLRTPASQSRAVARAFPAGRLLLARGAGHGVLSSPLRNCAQALVRQWMLGRAPARRCEVAKPLPFAQAFPARFAAVAPVKYRGRLGRTVAAVHATISDAVLLAGQCLRAALAGGCGQAGRPAFGGAAGGHAALSGPPRQQGLARVRLERYAWVRGARLAGALTIATTAFGLTVAISGGVLRVRGSLAAHGTVRVMAGGRFSGVLGGRRISYP